MGYIAIAVCFGLAGGIVGRIKGSPFWIWFLVSGAVPIFGLIAAIAYRSDRNEPRRRCPKCGRITMAYDALCTRCGEEFEYPDELLPPEATASGSAARPY